MQAKDMTYVIGIDTGGTFTDVVVLDSSGKITTNKSPTTPWDFSIGVMDAIHEAAISLGMERRELLAQTSMIKHGSTVATNALITRSGVVTGLITTRGFEDTTAVMRGVGRVDGLPEEEVRHMARVTKPEPLIPRGRIRGVSERVDYKGGVLVPIDLEEVGRLAHELVEEENAEAIAVNLLQSWANPIHEQRIKELAASRFPDIYWSFGSELSQEAGEYARGNTGRPDTLDGWRYPCLRQLRRGPDAANGEWSQRAVMADHPEDAGILKSHMRAFG